MRDIFLLLRRPTALAASGIVPTMSRLRKISMLFIQMLYFSLASFGQCPVTITPDYCNIVDGKILLTSSSAASYTWNTGATTQAIRVPVSGKGIYTVTVTGTGCTPSNNKATRDVGSDIGDLVTNGNFTDGNMNIFTAYGYVQDGTYNGLVPEGYYSISPNPNPVLHYNFWGYDHTHFAGTPSQNYMVVNGSPVANITVWMQSVNVQPNTDYYFSVWAMSLNDDTNHAILQLNINNSAVVASYTLPAGVRSNNNTWYHYYTTWNSGALSGPIPISITDLNVIRGGNDFGIDDISFSKLNPVSLTVPTVTGNNPCPEGTINLTSSVTGGTAPLTYFWTGPNGFRSQEQNPNRLNATTAMSGIYRVTVTDYFNCTQNNSVNVSVSSGITLDANASSTTICAGTPINLSSSANPITTTLLSENFNGVTNNWTKTNNSAGLFPANAAWTLRKDGYNVNTTYHSNDNTQFYLSDSRSQGLFTTRTETWLTSPVMNTTGYSSLSLDFYHYFEFANVNNERATVEVSTDGTNWIPITTYNNTKGSATNFAPPVINLNAYINNATFQIRFHYYALGSARYWAIDNVTLSGTSNNYQISWDSNPAGFTSNEAIPLNVTPLVQTTYTVTYTNPTTGCFESKPVAVTVQDAPAITTQPENMSVCGGSASFNVVASGGTFYQWELSPNGVTSYSKVPNSGVYSGVNTPTLNISNVTGLNSYKYHCVINNGPGTCSTTSDAATLTITGSAPTITNPVDLFKCEGQNGAFSVVSNGQTFQWELSAGGTSYSNVPISGVYSGVNTATLNISNVTGLNSYKYRCTATITGCGSTTSAPATLNVYPYPVINANGNPVSITICPNTNATFSVAATLTPTGTITYQWQEYDGAAWTDIPKGGIYSGEKTSSLSLTSVPDTYNGYQYRCNVSTPADCPVTTAAATLSITTEPAISFQPTSQSICEATGESATFNLTASSTGTLNYQWLSSKDGTNWNSTGTNSPTLTQNYTVGIGGTQYKCIVTDNCSNSVTSDIVTLTYKSKPVITQQPSSTTACYDYGVFVIFSVDALEGVAYQWLENGVPLNNDVPGVLMGVQASSLAVYTTDATKNGYQYQCVLTSKTTFCSQTSDPATLTTYPAPSYNISGTRSYCQGSSTTLTADITGGYEYLWSKDGVSTGITTQSITIKSKPDGGLGPGDYTAKVTNSTTRCEYTRIPATVTETAAAPQVSVSIDVSSNPICTGSYPTFTAHAVNAGSSPTYQWKLNGNNVGVNDYQLTSISPSNGDKITCELTAVNVTCAANNSNPATSNEIIMTVSSNLTPGVSISASPSSPICSGTSVTFTAKPENGGANPTYQWKKFVLVPTPGWTDVGTNSAIYIDAGLKNNERIECVLASSLACVSSPKVTSNILQFTVNPSPFPYNVTGGSPHCVGESVTIGLDNSGTTATKYHLLRDGVEASTHLDAGAAFSFTPAQTLAGVYKVSAELGTCKSMMKDSVIIGAAPVITNPPANSTICAGANTSFSITATGVTLGYQWKVNQGSGFVSLNNTGVYDGVTTPTLNITGADAGMNGYIYQCIITSGTCLPLISATATLTVNSPPAITSGPTASAAVCSGKGNQTLNVIATGTGLTYSWRKDGIAVSNGEVISGQGTATLTLTNPTTADAGNYDVIISGACATSLTSNTVAVTVISPPAITGQPIAPQAVCSGNGTINISVTATGTEFSYRWYRYITAPPGAPISDGGVYSGATTSTLTIKPTAASAAYYYVELRGGTCNTTPYPTSNPVAVTVNTAPTLSMDLPAPQQICLGSNATFTVSATGAGLTYQWQENTGSGSDFSNFKDGGVYSGSTSSTLTLINPPVGMSGYRYRVMVSGSCLPSPPPSSVAELTFFTSLVAGGHDTTSVTACPGYDPSKLDINNPYITTGSSPYLYQWQLNGADISGATSRPYDPPVLTIPGTYTYNCKITDACNSVVYTAGKTITIVSNPTVTVSGGAPVCQNDPSPLLSAYVSNGTVISYQWQFSTSATGPWTKIPSATSSTYSPPTSTAGTIYYQVSITTTEPAGCNTANSDSVGITVNALPTTSAIYHQ